VVTKTVTTFLAAPEVETLALRIPGALTVTSDVSEGQWDAYVRGHPHATPDHLWAWRRIFEGVFAQQCAYLAALRDGAVVGVLPLVCFRSRLFGRFVVSVPYLNYGGVLASNDGAARALVAEAERLAREFGASSVELRHQTRQFEELPHRQHKISMRLALPPTTEELWKAMDRKIRNQVRKAQKERLVAVEGGASLVDEFYSVFAHNMRDVGTPVYPKRLFEETLKQLPEHAHVHVVRHRGRPVAGAVSVLSAGTVLVPWASSLRQYRHLCPNMLLYWSMLERAVAGGATIFDFGRSSPGAGTHHFKQQWGAVEVPLYWEYVLLTGSVPPDHGPSNPRFNAAIKVWQRLPLWLVNTIGPTIVRNIP